MGHTKIFRAEYQASLPLDNLQKAAMTLVKLKVRLIKALKSLTILFE
jgi:hypothetical protein